MTVPAITTATYAGLGDGSGPLAALVALGFVFGPPRHVTRTLLDTFDGRLFAAGLRLEASGPDVLVLVLSSDSGDAHLPVDALPRRTEDLPPGPFRERLEAVVSVRALLPIARLDAEATEGVWRDAADKTAVTAIVHADLTLDGAAVAGAPGWTAEVHGRVGHDGGASQAAGALAAAGYEPARGDTVGLVAAAAGVDLRGFDSTPSVPLDATMPALEGFCVVLDHLAGAAAANWEGTLQELDTEFLHDLRVAVRRTRSVARDGKRVLPEALAVHGREAFAWLASLTGPARDLDVQLLAWDTTAAALGEDARFLAPVRDLLEQRARVAHTHLEDGLRSPRAEALLPTWRAALADPSASGPGGDHATRPLGEVVARRISRAQAHLVEQGRSIGPHSPATALHELRKDAKRLRYLIECFGSLLAPRPRRRLVRRLKALQDNLGALQDADVHIVQLTALAPALVAAGVRPETLLALGRLIERQHRASDAARAEFATRFRAYDSDATAAAFEAMLEPATP